MPVGFGINKRRKDYQGQLELITVNIPQWHRSGFFVDNSIIVTCLPEFSINNCDNITIDYQDQRYCSNIELVDNFCGLVFLSLPDMDFGDMLLPLCETITDIEPFTNAYLSCYDDDCYEPSGASIVGLRSVNKLSDKRQFIKLNPSSISSHVLGAPVWSIDTKNIIGIVNKIKDNHAYGSSSSLLAIPSVTVLESLTVIKNNDNNADISSALVTEKNLDRVFSMSEVAYEEASPYRSSFANAEITHKQLIVLNQNRRKALTRWFKTRNDCLRFIVENTSEVTHVIGLTCVLPLSKRAYYLYRSGKKKEFDIQSGDISKSKSIEEYDYLCFQSFVYAGKNLRNIFTILKKSIVDHVFSLSSSEKGIYCIAEIGTKAGNRISQLFPNGEVIGFSSDNRPLIEWKFSYEELSDIVRSLQ